MSDKWINNAINIGKKNGKVFVVVKKDCTLKEGQFLYVQTREEYYGALLEKQKITEEEHENQLNKKTSILYYATVPPVKKDSN